MKYHESKSDDFSFFTTFSSTLPKFTNDQEY
jgi:hypothetical protein